MGTFTHRSLRAWLFCFAVLFLSACNNSDDSAPNPKSLNQAPVAENVAIVDASGGALYVGDELSGTYEFSDAENDPEGQSTYRWIRGSTTVDTDQFYTLTADDHNQTLIFEVKPVATDGTALGTENSVSLFISLSNKAPVISNLIMKDNPKGTAIDVNDVLTTEYDYVDNEGDADASTYQWTRGTDPIEPIAGETGRSYTLDPLLDAAQTIGFEILPMDETGSTTGIVQRVIAVEGNNHPVAMPDSFTVPEVQPPYALIGLVANDTDADLGIDENLEVFSFDNTGTIGEAIMNPGRGGGYHLNGMFEYLASGEQVTDRFSYTVIDGKGGYDSADIDMVILGVNDRPQPQDDMVQVNENDSDVIINVLSNDIEIDTSDILKIITVTLATNPKGTVGISADFRSLTYTPQISLAAGETDIDSFTYDVGDYSATAPNGSAISTNNTATVTVTIVGQ